MENKRKYVKNAKTDILIMPNKFLQVIFLLTSFISSCNINVTGVKNDDQIEDSLRNEIYKIGEKVYADLLKNNMEYALSISSPKYEESFAQMNEALQNMQVTSPGEIEKIAEFLLSTDQPGKIQKVSSIFEGEKFYYLIQPEGEMTYAYLFAIPNNTANGKNLISLVLNKKGDEWELIRMNIGSLLYDGKTAIDIYDTANKLYQKGQIIPAITYSQLALTLMNPSNGSFIYDKQDEITEFVRSIESELPEYYAFPFEVSELTSLPQMAGYKTQVVKGIIYPEVSYYSNIDIGSKTAINDENLSVHKIIESIYPGISTISDSIFYVVGNSSDPKNPIAIHRASKH